MEVRQSYQIVVLRSQLGAMISCLTFTQVCLCPVTVLYAAYAFKQSSPHNIYKELEVEVGVKHKYVTALG